MSAGSVLSPSSPGTAPCGTVACPPVPAAEAAPAGPLAASGAGSGDGGHLATFVVLSVLLVALLVVVAVGLAQRRRGCRLWRPSTWSHTADDSPPVKPPAGPLPEIRVVPLVVVMPCEQVQYALQASGSTPPPALQLHAAAGSSSGGAWAGAGAAPQLEIVVEGRPAAGRSPNGKQPLER